MLMGLASRAKYRFLKARVDGFSQITMRIGFQFSSDGFKVGPVRADGLALDHGHTSRLSKSRTSWTTTAPVTVATMRCPQGPRHLGQLSEHRGLQRSLVIGAHSSLESLRKHLERPDEWS